MVSNSPSYSAIIESPIGPLGFNVSNNKLYKIDFFNTQKLKLIKPATPLAKEVAKQINNYFIDSSFEFDLPITLEEGTAFQQQVWALIASIPVGNALSYGAAAKQLGSSARAVGNACRRNPIPLVIPCHRIIGSNGIGGFNGVRKGQPLDVKSWLLKHENFVI